MKTLLTFLPAAMLHGSSFAQDSTRAGFKIMLLPTEAIFLNFPLSLEKLFNRHSAGLTLAYRPATKNGGEIAGGKGLAGAYLDQNYRNPIYNALTLGLNTKYFLSKKNNAFIDAQVFYRRLWFRNKACSFDNVEGYRFDAMRTEEQNVYGFKLLFGNSIGIKTGGRIRPVIDAYCGLGLRYKTFVLETRNGTVNDRYYDYKREAGNNWSSSGNLSFLGPVSFHLGVKTGIGFYHVFCSNTATQNEK